MILLLVACVDPSPYAEPPALTTEVEDWRDEIIYQVMIDRFADGDVNNDYNATDHPEVMSRYLGGDWRGLIDNVGYLEALGTRFQYSDKPLAVLAGGATQTFDWRSAGDGGAPGAPSSPAVIGI